MRTSIENEPRSTKSPRKRYLGYDQLVIEEFKLVLAWGPSELQDLQEVIILTVENHLSLNLLTRGYPQLLSKGRLLLQHCLTFLKGGMSWVMGRATYDCVALVNELDQLWLANTALSLEVVADDLPLRLIG